MLERTIDAGLVEWHIPGVEPFTSEFPVRVPGWYWPAYRESARCRNVLTEPAGTTLGDLLVESGVQYVEPQNASRFALALFCR